MGSQANVYQIGQLLRWILLLKKRRSKFSTLRDKYLINAMKGQADIQISVNSYWALQTSEKQWKLQLRHERQTVYWAVITGNKNIVANIWIRQHENLFNMVDNLTCLCFLFLRSHTFCLFCDSLCYKVFKIHWHFKIFKCY